MFASVQLDDFVIVLTKWSGSNISVQNVFNVTILKVMMEKKP